MRFVAPLEIRRFGPAGDLVPLDIEAARSIAAEFADGEGEPAGAPPPRRPEVLGYFDGEPLCLDRRGVLVTHVGYLDTSRLFACRRAFVQRFGCEVRLGDSGEDWFGSWE